MRGNKEGVGVVSLVQFERNRNSEGSSDKSVQLEFELEEENAKKRDLGGGGIQIVGGREK